MTGGGKLERGFRYSRASSTSKISSQLGPTDQNESHGMTSRDSDAVITTIATKTIAASTKFLAFTLAILLCQFGSPHLGQAVPLH